MSLELGLGLGSGSGLGLGLGLGPGLGLSTHLLDGLELGGKLGHLVCGAHTWTNMVKSKTSGGHVTPSSQ